MLDDRNDTVAARQLAGRGIWARTSNETAWTALLGDLLALGAMRVALTQGLRLPEDLAIVGFDNIEDGQYNDRARQD